MTHRQPSTPAWWRLLLAAIAALVVGVLGAGTASATTLPELGNRVGASTPVVVNIVGVHESISAGQRWGHAPPQAETAVATGVAANSESRLARGLSELRANPERGSIRIPGGGLSPNQMNRAIQRGQAPPGLRRVDTGKVTGEQTHMHFDDGSALNMDGTWKHGGTNITNGQAGWLEGNGWVIPRG